MKIVPLFCIISCRCGLSLLFLVCSKGAVGGFFVYMWFFAANNKVFLLIYVVVLLNLRYGSEGIASNILL